MLKYNYHTHTLRCNHAKDDIEQYVLNAIKSDMKVLGFSCHIPFKFNNTSKIRMKLEELEPYIEELRDLKTKYRDLISIKIGFEAEYIKEEIPFYEYLLNNEIVEYLILGHHLYDGYNTPSSRITTKSQLDLYIDTAIQAMQSGFYKYIAHPDIFMCSLLEFDQHCIDATIRLCDFALENDIIFEYNCEGLRDTLNGHIFPNNTNIGYPRPEFWQIVADKQVKVILGMDAHSASSINDNAVHVACENCKDLNLNIIEKLDI